MKACIILLIVVLVFLSPVEGCMRGGISGRATAALIGICVIFSPVILVGGAGYFGVKTVKSGVNEVKNKINNRKRTSNLIKKQRNRMVKKVGSKNFENYIQQLFDKCQTTNSSPDSVLELGTALFLNNDLHNAYHWVTKAIDSCGVPLAWNKIGSAYFVRGMINQYLSDFSAAIVDFDNAQKAIKDIAINPAEASELPTLTLADAINARGYAKMLKALYELDVLVNEAEMNSLLDDAIADITTAINTTAELQGMYFHNRGYARYHRNVRLPAEERKKELLGAIEDFDTAIKSGNFGTTAEGHAMKAQALALIGNMNFAQVEVAIAEELDPKVFIVDLNDEHQLCTPWPLPREKFKNQDSTHSFVETTFHRPHYCNHCTNLIKIGPGYICYVCDFRAHKQCYPKVKGKDCWESMMKKMDGASLESEEKKEDASDSHVHHLKAVHFHKPTWCGLCAKIVASPFGKQGYQCIDCGVKLHKDCLDIAGTYFIEKE